MLCSSHCILCDKQVLQCQLFAPVLINFDHLIKVIFVGFSIIQVFFLPFVIKYFVASTLIIPFLIKFSIYSLIYLYHYGLTVSGVFFLVIMIHYYHLTLKLFCLARSNPFKLVLYPSDMSPSFSKHLLILWHKIFQTHLLLSLPQPWNQENGTQTPTYECSLLLGITAQDKHTQHP